MRRGSRFQCPKNGRSPYLRKFLDLFWTEPGTRLGLASLVTEKKLKYKLLETELLVCARTFHFHFHRCDSENFANDPSPKTGSISTTENLEESTLSYKQSQKSSSRRPPYGSRKKARPKGPEAKLSTPTRSPTNTKGSAKQKTSFQGQHAQPTQKAAQNVQKTSFRCQSAQPTQKAAANARVSCPQTRDWTPKACNNRKSSTKRAQATPKLEAPSLSRTKTSFSGQ